MKSTSEPVFVSFGRYTPNYNGANNNRSVTKVTLICSTVLTVCFIVTEAS